jgi:hypothetical protein
VRGVGRRSDGVEVGKWMLIWTFLVVCVVVVGEVEVDVVGGGCCRMIYKGCDVEI